MKSECSKRKWKQHLNYFFFFFFKYKIPHVKFTHKRPTAGEGPVANEVYFGQRKQ